MRRINRRRRGEKIIHERKTQEKIHGSRSIKNKNKKKTIHMQFKPMYYIPVQKDSHWVDWSTVQGGGGREG